MSERLRQLGIHSGQARSAALFQLATDLPATVLRNHGKPRADLSPPSISSRASRHEVAHLFLTRYMRCRIPALPSARHAATASMAALRAVARDQYTIGHVDH